jgi:hypothetical protein
MAPILEGSGLLILEFAIGCDPEVVPSFSLPGYLCPQE